MDGRAVHGERCFPVDGSQRCPTALSAGFAVDGQVADLEGRQRFTRVVWVGKSGVARARACSRWPVPAGL